MKRVLILVAVLLMSACAIPETKACGLFPLLRGGERIGKVRERAKEVRVRIFSFARGRASGC